MFSLYFNFSRSIYKCLFTISKLMENCICMHFSCRNPSKEYWHSPLSRNLNCFRLSPENVARPARAVIPRVLIRKSVVLSRAAMPMHTRERINIAFELSTFRWSVQVTRALQVLRIRRSDDIPIRQTRRASRGKSDRLADYFSSYYSRTGFTDISIRHLRPFVSNTIRRKATFYCVAYCNGCSISMLMISPNLGARSFINIEFQWLIDVLFIYYYWVLSILYVEKSRLLSPLPRLFYLIWEVCLQTTVENILY